MDYCANAAQDVLRKGKALPAEFLVAQEGYLNRHEDHLHLVAQGRGHGESASRFQGNAGHVIRDIVKSDLKIMETAVAEAAQIVEQARQTASLTEF